MPSSLRVSRLRKSKVPFSPSRGIKMSQTNYNVMRNKGLQRKLDATDITHLTRHGFGQGLIDNGYFMGRDCQEV
jgi:hypothetical protein